MANRVVIIGRPNVGKSSLFNRIIGKRKAVVEDIPGVTRDYLEALTEWAGKKFILVDTGGFIPKTSDEITEKVKEAVKREVKKASVIVFTVSVKEGITPIDEEIAKLLYPFREKVILAVNKVDSPEEEKNAFEFFSLGFEKVIFLSAIHGRGVEDLLEEIAGKLKRIPAALNYEGIRIAFVGRPNVGKSSLMNALLREERLIVSHRAGTTRDMIEIPFNWENNYFVLIDTPGIRRPSKVEYGVEFFSVNRALKAIENSEVLFLVIDGSEGVTRQDKRIGGLIERRYKGCVIVVNKVDLCPLPREKAISLIKKELFFLDFAPIVFTVATEGSGLSDMLKAVLKVYADFTKKHKTSFVNRAVQKILKEKAPPNYRGKEVKVYYSFQQGIKPPQVVLITNYPEGWKESYKRFFIKRLRKLLGIEHSPIKLIFKERN